MNIKSFLFPLLYSTLIIAATCITFYGGHSKSINAVSIIGLLLVIPFCVVAMIYSKRVIHNNIIGGKDLVKEGLKGSGDYGVFGLGVYNGQTANKPELNNSPHIVARASYPFEIGNQVIEPGFQGYTGNL